MESFFSTLKTVRLSKKHYRTRDDLRADVFDYMKRFCKHDPFSNFQSSPKWLSRREGGGSRKQWRQENAFGGPSNGDMKNCWGNYMR
ncbi:hypothetical protein FHW67_002539 [Herbaspirillum sp. Sphag1AN]|nr:hypothetical protein [Herbaspirillum sp. Sphag1AN]MBB3246447.1 hypothetical protein [Herbaspirillum sp. Sphag64]